MGVGGGGGGDTLYSIHVKPKIKASLVSRRLFVSLAGERCLMQLSCH